MVLCTVRDILYGGEIFEYVASDSRVLLYNAALLIGEFPGLCKYAVRYADFSYIMQECNLVDMFLLRRTPIHTACNFL